MGLARRIFFCWFYLFSVATSAANRDKFCVNVLHLAGQTALNNLLSEFGKTARIDWVRADNGAVEGIDPDAKAKIVSLLLSESKYSEFVFTIAAEDPEISIDAIKYFLSAVERQAFYHYEKNHNS